MDHKKNYICTLPSDIILYILDYLPFMKGFNFIKTSKLLRNRFNWRKYVYKNVVSDYHVIVAASYGDIDIIKQVYNKSDRHILNLSLHFTPKKYVVELLIKLGARVPKCEVYYVYNHLIRNRYFVNNEHYRTNIDQLNFKTAFNKFSNQIYERDLDSIDCDLVSGSDAILGFNSGVYNCATGCIVLGYGAVAYEDHQLVIGSVKHPIQTIQENGKDYIKLLLNGRKAKIPIEWDE